MATCCCAGLCFVCRSLLGAAAMPLLVWRSLLADVALQLACAGSADKGEGPVAGFRVRFAELGLPTFALLCCNTVITSHMLACQVLYWTR